MKAGPQKNAKTKNKPCNEFLAYIWSGISNQASTPHPDQNPHGVAAVIPCSSKYVVLQKLCSFSPRYTLHLSNIRTATTGMNSLHRLRHLNLTFVSCCQGCVIHRILLPGLELHRGKHFTLQWQQQHGLLFGCLVLCFCWPLELFLGDRQRTG